MNEVITWLKLGDTFINQHNIRAIARQGNGTRIERLAGDDVFVEVNYEKVEALLPPDFIG